MKRKAALLISAIMGLTAVSFNPAYGEEYITRGEAVETLMGAADDYSPGLKQEDVIRGYGDGDLHEDDPLTKVQALVMLNRAFGGIPQPGANNRRLGYPSGDFGDVPVWAQDELTSVFDSGIIDTIDSDAYVTAEELDTLIDRTYSVFGTNLRDSYYAAVNKSELDVLEIPTGAADVGTLADISNLTTRQIKELILEIANSDPEPGTPEAKIKTLYDNIMDMDARNEAGYSPIAEDLKEIESAESIADLGNVMILNDRVSALYLLTAFSVTLDPMNSSEYVTYFGTASPRLPREVYAGEAEEQRAAYIRFITTLLELCDDENPEENAQAFFDFEKQISQVSLTIAESYDLANTYNIYTLDELKSVFPMLDIQGEFERAGLSDGSRIGVGDVAAMEELASMLRDDNLDAVKNYLKISLILDTAGYFGEDFIAASQTYNQEVYGIEGEQSSQDRAVLKVSDMLYDYVGKAYADKYCTDEIVADVTDMIHQVISVYEDRIMGLDWMSEATKEKALLKLSEMRINVGAPDYSKMESAQDGALILSIADGGSYFDNAIELEMAEREYNAALAGKPVDKDQWITTPQTVNAFYMPNFNSINFPVAFLKEPVYSKDASFEENLGGIGFVIAHEITHAFDSSGSQYDEKGNARDWWTQEDKEAFERLCNEVVEYYDGIEAAPGIEVNGTLTLTENIADLGAMQCITQIADNTEDFDYDKMFRAYALLWLESVPREYLQALVFSDTHSPSNVRVDRVLQSVECFYQVYDINEDDGMYVPPEERAAIW